MDIVATFAPPRLCYLAGKPHWVRPMPIEGFATLIAWIDDVSPGRADRKAPPLLNAPESQAAIESTHGFVLLVWLALRDQGVGYAAAAALAMACDEHERARLYDVLFARRRYADRSGLAGEDLAASWWGPGIMAMSKRVTMLVNTIGKLTLDQLDCYTTEGAPCERPGRLTEDQVQAMWEAARAAAPTIPGPEGVHDA